MPRSLVIAVAALVLLVACGSSSSESESTTTTTRISAADQRLARAAVLRSGDAPGFQRVAARQSELADLPATAASLPACSFFIAGGSHRTLTARSDGLQKDTVIVDSSLAVYPDAATAQAELERFREPKMVACLQKAYSSNAGNVDVSPIAPNDLGDDRVAYRISPTGLTNPSKVIDVIVVRVGRVLFSVNISGAPADSAELQSNTIPKVVDRVRAAGA